MGWTFGQEEFLLTYQNQLDVMQGLKDKAWKATHYSVLGQAAVYALHRSDVVPCWTNDTLTTVLSVIIFFWAGLLVSDLQGGICDRREATKYLRSLDVGSPETETFALVWNKIKKERRPRPSLWNRWNDDRNIFWAYLAAISIPFLLVVGLVWLPA